MAFDTFVNAENNATTNAGFGVKVSYGNEIRRAACADPSYAALCEVVAKLFELGEPAKLTLKYQDEDGDKITMSSDAELQEAIRLAKTAKKIIRLFVETNTPIKEEEMKPADPDVVEVEGPADHWRGFHARRGGMGMWGRGGFHHGPLHHTRFPPHHGPGHHGPGHHGPGPFPHHGPLGAHARGFHHGPYSPRGGMWAGRGFHHGPFGGHGPCAEPAPAQPTAAEGENVNAAAQDPNANPAPAPEDVRLAPPPFHHPHHPHHGPWGPHPWGAAACGGGEEWRKAMKERKQAIKEHRKAMKDHLGEMKAACQTKEDKEAIKAFKEAMKEEWKDAWKEMKKLHKEEAKDEKEKDKHHDKHEKHHKKHDKFARDESGEKLMARHVADVTIPDNSMLPADTPVIKTWKLKNVGTTAWPADSQLIFVSRHGDNLNGPERVPVPGPIEPGQEVDVSVPFITPAEPGRYVGYYRMATGDGVKFGQRVWVSFLIPAAAANTTVVTAPRTPTTPTAPRTPTTPSTPTAPTAMDQ